MTYQRERTGTRPEVKVDTGALLDLALHMANRADEIALGGFAGGMRFDTKSDGSPVTRIDREVESVLRDTIEREHPQAGVLGEEYGEEQGVGRWVIDPIDGTQQYIEGDPKWAVLIAYEVGDEPVLGVISAPALGLRWWAGAGLGARMSYRGVVSAARVSMTKRVSKAYGILVGGFHSEGWPTREHSSVIEERLAAAGVRISRRGVSWEAVRVAGAEIDLALTTGARWDIAPLPVIVREAGGWAEVFEHGNGLNRIVLSNRQLVGELTQLI